MGLWLTVQNVDEIRIALSHITDLLSDDFQCLCAWDIAREGTSVRDQAIRDETVEDCL